MRPLPAEGVFRDDRAPRRQPNDHLGRITSRENEGFAILVTFDGLRQLGGDEGEQGWRRRGALLSNKSFSRAVGSTQDIDPN